MTRLRRRVVPALAVLVGVVVSTGTAGAQDEVLPISGVGTDDYPEVSIDFTTPPSMSGAVVIAENVTVTENGQPRDFELEAAEAENLELVVAIDTSGSMTGAAIEQAIVAAQELVRELPGGSRVALVGFGNEPVVLAEFSRKGEVIDAIGAIVVDPAAETSLYDATRVAIQQFSPSSTGPRYVVIVTDGGDTFSEGTMGAAQAAVQAADIPVFAVSLVTSESDPEALAALTAETGGAVIEADDPQALADLTRQIGSAIAAQYRVTYPSQSNGSTIIEVTVTDDEATATGQVGVELPRLIEPTPTPIPTPVEEPAAVVPPPTPPADSFVVSSTRNLSWLLPVGILLMGVALVILFAFLLWPTRKRRKPLRDMAPLAADVARESGSLMSNTSAAMVRAAERLVAARDGEGRLARRIDRAGIRMRPGEFIVMSILIAVVAALIGLLVSPAFALLAGLACLLGAHVLLGIRGNRRAKQFEEQLPMTLRVMSGGLRGGFSLAQVVELVTTESQSPTRDEFARLTLEENLGRDITDSFRDIGDRMQSDDFKWVAEAVEINRSVGGNLSEVLENVAETVRTRKNVKGQIKTLSAEGRLSAAILLAIPFITFAGEMIVDPELASELYTTNEGRVAIVIGLTLMTIATIWMRRIVRLKY